MNLRNHLILIVITLIAWAAFYFVGRPFNHYLDWNVAERVLLFLVTAFAIVPYIAFFVLLFLRGASFKTSLWFAFYASVLVFVLDLIMAGIVEGVGLRFMISHWLQTLGYLYAWISIPLLGFAMVKMSEKSI